METDARPVVVGFDGSEEAERALVWGSRWAAAAHRPLRVVGVIDSFTVNGAPVTLTRRDPLNALRERAESAVAACSDGVDGGVQIDVTTGQPAKVLVEASQRAALVVVGRRGLGAASRMVLGSVSSKVLHHAACTVCVVPSSASGPKAGTT